MNDLLMTVFLDSLPFFTEPHVGILTFLLLHNFQSRYYETLCDYFYGVFLVCCLGFHGSGGFVFGVTGGGGSELLCTYMRVFPTS